MHQRAMAPEDCAPVDIHLVPTWDEARQFLVSRRSVRVYVNKPVEKEKISQCLDVARFAASGSNRLATTVRFVVVGDPALVRRVAQMSIDWMESVEAANPRCSRKPSSIFSSTSGKLVRIRFRRGAPCFIQAWAPRDERTAPPATTIALTYVQLAAHALGLGSSLEWRHQHRRAGPPSLDRLLGLPTGTVSFGTILLGYSAETFTRIPVRKAPDVSWL